MTKDIFLNQIKQNCSQATFVSVKHITDKLYKDNIELDEEKNKEFFANYKNYHIYLNDFAATIYTQYNSSVDNIYIEVCKFLDIDIDNSYILEYSIKKLEKQTPQLILGLSDEDIKQQTIVNFEEKILNIENSKYFISHNEQFAPRVKKLKANITLVKNALGIISV